MEEKNKVTKDEWIAFMEVRQDGQYNMFSPEARNSAGLDKDKWKNIIRNFDYLNSWKVIILYFLFLISILYILNRYFISNIDIIEFQIIEEKVK